jgi:predicted ATPase with chaperone activity
MTHRSKLIKQNIDLDKAEYEIVRNSILKNLLVYGTMTSEQLALLVRDHLESKSESSLWRYYYFVMQELERRGEIRSVPDSYPPQVEIAA